MLISFFAAAVIDMRGREVVVNSKEIIKYRNIISHIIIKIARRL